MIFTVCKCLRRSNNNTFTGMNTQRIEIFHVADSDAIVEFVPYNFIFNFFPSLERFFNKNLVCI